MTAIRLLVLNTFAIAVAAQKCPLQFDGRVPTDATLDSFDTSASPFNPQYVLGASEFFFDRSWCAATDRDKDEKWSSVLQFPNVNSSLVGSHFFHLVCLLTHLKFDANGTKALEVTISPSSIFQSQTGFRRSELLPASNSGTDPSTAGVKTIHFSVQKDTLRSLNTSHEYQLFFLESNDYSTNQVVLKYGSIIGGNPNGVSSDSLMVVGNVNANPVALLYSTKFTPGTWHNFGITLNFNAG